MDVKGKGLREKGFIRLLKQRADKNRRVADTHGAEGENEGLDGDSVGRTFARTLLLVCASRWSLAITVLF
jgi:hypothetical protein